MPAWLLTMASHWSFKAISIGLLIALLGLGCFTIYRGISNKAYHKGYSQALVDHPQNNYYGPTTVIQGKKMGCFPLKLGRWGLGICHE